MPRQYSSDNMNMNLYTVNNNESGCCINQAPLFSWQSYPTSLIKNRNSWSEVSSVTTNGDSDCSSTLNIRTPDIDLSDVIGESIVRSSYYSSLLHDSALHPYLKSRDTFFHSNDYQQLNLQTQPSVYFHNGLSSCTRGFYSGCSDSLDLVQQQILSQGDHYSLLPTSVNESQATYFPERHSEEFNAFADRDTNTLQTLLGTKNALTAYPAHPNTSLIQLSKKELINRVIQLETERNYNTVQNNNEFGLQVDRDDSDSSSIIMHPCKWIGCNILAPTLAQLMTHICEIHVGSGKATYACEWTDCIRNKKPFLKRHKMYNHMRTHTGERPFICTVPGCKKTFSRPDSLSTHVKTHSNIRPYLCAVPGCQKAYFHSRSLRKHLKSTHMSSARRSAPNQ